MKPVAFLFPGPHTALRGLKTTERLLTPGNWRVLLTWAFLPGNQLLTFHHQLMEYKENLNGKAKGKIERSIG